LPQTVKVGLCEEGLPSRNHTATVSANLNIQRRKPRIKEYI